VKKVGAVAYRIQLPEEMSDIHLVFHVSQLRKCLRITEEEIVPVETIDLQKDLRYQEVPVKILDTVTKRTRSSEVRSRRSYVGTRRCIKEGISPSVQNSVESRGRDSF